MQSVESFLHLCSAFLASTQSVCQPHYVRRWILLTYKWILLFALYFTPVLELISKQGSFSSLEGYEIWALSLRPLGNPFLLLTQGILHFSKKGGKENLLLVILVENLIDSMWL